MSWWGSGWTDIASQASQALKNAQSKIDKVLDIQDEDEEGVKPSTSAKVEAKKSSSSKQAETGSEFWNSWLNTDPSSSDGSSVASTIKFSDKKTVAHVADSETAKTQNLIRKSSEENLKIKDSNSRLTPRSSKEKDVSSSKAKDTSETGGWGQGWGDTQGSASDSWSSFNLTERTTKIETKKSPRKGEKQEKQQNKSTEQSDSLSLGDTGPSLNLNIPSSSNISDEIKSTEKPVDLCKLDEIEKDDSNEEQTTELGSDYSNFPPATIPTSVMDTADPDLKVSKDCTDLLIGSDTSILSLSGYEGLQALSKTCETETSDNVTTDIMSRTETGYSDSQEPNEKLLESNNKPESETIKTNRPDDLPVFERKHDQISELTLEVYPSSALPKLPTETSQSTGSFTRVSAEESQVDNLDCKPAELFTDNKIDNLIGMDTLSSDTDPNISENSASTIVATEELPAQYEDDVAVSWPVNTDYQKAADDSTDVSVSWPDKNNEEQSAETEEKKDENRENLDVSLATSNSGDTLVEEKTVNLGNESLGESFVNVSCMLEEAMVEMNKASDSGSDSNSNGEKSECSKVDSENDKSVSGHDSGDDIETTTSSDIEIISTPTPNGEYKLFDLSPLKLALQKTVARGSTSHHRTDSQSSSSTYSKAGESDPALSPGRDSVERQEIDSGDDGDNEHHRRASHDEHKYKAPELSVVSEESNNPYQTDKLLKTANKQELEIVKKLAETAEVLQAREKKLIQLSKENNDLLEANSILRSQLEQSELAHEAKTEDVDAITEEFKLRMAESERKLNAVIKEKENLKKQLKSVQDELQKKVNDRSQQKLMEEKDEQIKELLEEGEKLSKQQLQSNNIIKKLRVKEKENDSLITSQKSKIEEMKKELDHLRKVCDSKADLEKKQTDAINQLNSAVQKQEKELIKYRSEEEDYHEKLRSLQTALDNSYKEIAELHKANAAQDSKATEIAKSLEQQIREEAQFAMNKELLKARAEKESLIMQIEDLRISMARVEKEQNRKEDMLRQEISDLQYQLQADELRNQELSQNVSSTTRPLLRQIENLQAAYKSQASSFEKVEKNLTDRLNDTQNQLAIALDKERTASEQLMDITAQVTSLEAQTTRLKQEKSQLIVQTGLDKTKIEMLEESKQNETAHIEAIKNQMSKEIAELKRDKVFLENQIEVEKNKMESEKRRYTVLEEQIKILERERPKSRGTPSPISVSRQDSLASFTDQPQLFSSIHQDEILERSLYMTSPNNAKSVYEQLRHTGATALIEGLESQLKLKEGEITQLQSEIGQLERTRESMAKELVNLTNQVEELEEKLKDYPELLKNYKELDGRYNAILQMYGEKVEETEELKLDLEDVKEMYKQQINHLLTN